MTEKQIRDVVEPLMEMAQTTAVHVSKLSGQVLALQSLCRELFWCVFHAACNDQPAVIQRIEAATKAFVADMEKANVEATEFRQQLDAKRGMN